MATGRAIRTYEYAEGWESGLYKITIRSGKRKRVIVRGSEQEARMAMAQEGFFPIAWAEGRKIILQGED
jgi:hypothetical protein